MNEKIDSIKVELNEYYQTKKDLLELLKQIQQDYKKNNDNKLNKRKKPNYYVYFKTLKDLKEINLDIKFFHSKLKSYSKESRHIRKAINECGFAQLRFKNQYARDSQQDFISLKQKQEHLKFLLTHKNVLSKEQKEILKDLKKELQDNSQTLNNNLKYIALDSNQIELIRKLGIKNSSYSLIHAKENITKVFNIINRMDRYYLKKHERNKIYLVFSKT